MIQFIYEHSPIFFQNIMASVQGQIFKKQRYSKYYFNEMKILENCDDFNVLQKHRLQNFYSYIRENSEYYKSILKEYGDEVSLNNLKTFPELTKDDIRNNIETIVIKKNKNVVKKGTGGSTGKSMVYYSDTYDMSRKIAYLDYFKKQHGVYRGMKRVSVGGKKLYLISKRKNILEI